MKNNTVNTIKIVGATFIVLVLLFPSLVKFFHHTLEDHHHPICKESKIHFHEQEINCAIDSFFLASFQFDLLKIEFKRKTTFPVLKNYSEQKNVYTNLKESYHLRGPPGFFI